jgi:hypothetical protein
MDKEHGQSTQTQKHPVRIYSKIILNLCKIPRLRLKSNPIRMQRHYQPVSHVLALTWLVF